MQAHMRSACKIANYLYAHPMVEKILYPGKWNMNGQSEGKAGKPEFPRNILDPSRNSKRIIERK